MKECPVCELELEGPLPSFCPRCAWDLKSDPTLNVVSGSIPFMELRERLRFKDWFQF